MKIKLRNLFEKETGKEALIVPVCHGDKAYASWEYQDWLEKRCKKQEKVLKHFLHLHCCEMEGIEEGMPTPEMWIDAVRKAEEVVK